MSNHPTDPGHGDSPAAWTAVVVMLLGFALGTGAFMMHQAWLVWVGVGVGVIVPVGVGVKVLIGVSVIMGVSDPE